MKTFTVWACLGLAALVALLTAAQPDWISLNVHRWLAASMFLGWLGLLIWIIPGKVP